MEKKQLKLYETPFVEVVEMKTGTPLLANSVTGPGFDDDDIVGL